MTAWAAMKKMLQMGYGRISAERLTMRMVAIDETTNPICRIDYDARQVLWQLQVWLCF